MRACACACMDASALQGGVWVQTAQKACSSEHLRVGRASWHGARGGTFFFSSAHIFLSFSASRLLVVNSSSREGVAPSFSCSEVRARQRLYLRSGLTAGP